MLYLVSSGMGWHDALREFSTYQSAANLAEKTIRNREECLQHLGRRSGKGPLEISKADLQDHLTRKHPRTGERLKQGTMQSERSYLQTFFGWLKDEGYRQDNPAERLPRVKMARRKPRPFRLDQVDAMIDSGAYTRTRDIITICALTGLRIGEVVKIRGEHIDRTGMLLRTIRKGNLEHRIALGPMLAEIIDRYPEEGWWFPSPFPNREFPDGGGHILMRSASDAVSKAIRRAGITDTNLTAHSLRHFFATWLLRQGVNIRIVQEALGHASLATTQLYTEVIEEDLHEAATHLPTIERRAQSSRSRVA